MNADSGSEEGQFSNTTAAMFGIRFPKINTENMTKGRITKTIANFSMPLRIGDITFVTPISVGVDVKSDLVYDAFSLEYLIENDYRIEMSDTALKVIPPVKRTGCES